jgi:hypothetical protein
LHDFTEALPILIFAYNRPKTAERLFVEVENLEPRVIWVSIDGDPAGISDSQRGECLRSTKEWERRSKHEIRIVDHSANLGLYKHFRCMLGEFFGEFNVGIVLEDDIEFRKEFIEFVDAQRTLLESEKIWSICGNNPDGTGDLANKPRGDSIVYSQSDIHTISGWASNFSSIQKFLYFSSKVVSWSEINQAIDAFAKKVTRDPFLRAGIRSTWLRKAVRARKQEKKGSWDNWWEISAWASGKSSLLPNFSLSRESLNQDEGQAHDHKHEGVDWNTEGIFSDIEIELKIESASRAIEIHHLRIWGINRKYCWSHFLRLKREIIRISQENFVS